MYTFVFVCIGKWKDNGRVYIFEKRFALHKIYTWPLSFYFPMQTESVLQSLSII